MHTDMCRMSFCAYCLVICALYCKHYETAEKNAWQSITSASESCMHTVIISILSNSSGADKLSYYMTKSRQPKDDMGY